MSYLKFDFLIIIILPFKSIITIMILKNKDEIPE